MTRNTFLYFIFILIAGHTAFGQSDTLNKLNSKDKKIGYWKILLDDQGCIVKKIQNAYFYGYQYYVNGQKVGPYFNKLGYKKTSFSGKLPTKGSPQLIHGKVIVYDKYGRTFGESVYDNGVPQHYTSFLYYDNTDTNPILFEDIDFQKKYNGIPLTYFLQQHNSNGTTDSWWYRDGIKGWSVYKIE